MHDWALWNKRIIRKRHRHIHAILLGVFQPLDFGEGNKPHMNACLIDDRIFQNFAFEYPVVAAGYYLEILSSDALFHLDFGRLRRPLREEVH